MQKILICIQSDLFFVVTNRIPNDIFTSQAWRSCFSKQTIRVVAQITALTGRTIEVQNILQGIVTPKPYGIYLRNRV